MNGEIVDREGERDKSEVMCEKNVKEGSTPGLQNICVIRTPVVVDCDLRPGLNCMLPNKNTYSEVWADSPAWNE